jgi:cell wall-associated NlpC family hydrolase
MILTVVTPFADILGNPQDPSVISNADSQLLFGETFDVLESHGAYVKGRSVLDGYEGYVDRDQLVKGMPQANAALSVPLSHLYPEPSFKTRPIMPLSFFSKVILNSQEQDGFVQTTDNEWIFAKHVQKLDGFNIDKDLADIALSFLQTPYLFAGRSSLGIDCSGLIQLSILGTGAPCPPRDSLDQSTIIGSEITKDQLQRNDIVFFKGHVGIMIDQTNIINATARHMTTLIEPLVDLEKAYDGMTAIRRI